MGPRFTRVPFHLLRSSVVAGTMVTLAAIAHILGGGPLPGAGIMAATMALAGLASTLATRRKLSFPAMTAVLGAGQLALHEAFAALSARSPAASGSSMPHHHTAPAALPVASPGVASPGAEHLHQLDSAPAFLMLGLHAAATLACALLLAKGETALWGLASWLRPLVRLPSPVAPDAGPAPAVAGAGGMFPPLPWRNLRADSRRGPPAAVGLS